MSLDIFLFGSSGIRNVEAHIQRQSERAELIASNLANVETPGYKAKDLNFNQVLSRQNNMGADIGTAATHPAHFSDSMEMGEISVTRSVVDNSTRIDGNTVDLDTEMGKLAKIQLQYEAGLLALSKKFDLIRRASSNSA